MNLKNIINHKEITHVVAKTNLGYLIANCGKVEFHAVELKTGEFYTALENGGDLVITNELYPVRFDLIALEHIHSFIGIDAEVNTVYERRKLEYEVEAVCFEYKDQQIICDVNGVMFVGVDEDEHELYDEDEDLNFIRDLIA
ncbi:hypothetical protein [Citrobacter sp. Igbk 16]|uniref:hypothetical protein n=1 Tax=Citrobacter sp. Igbk 16 TaxID=2963958 RepID=UPI002302ECEC|nr:hypothetical protein [Citrobacter sp. Igbk 16]MDA8518976.1 hypothetical protein [Citrobacter sp. Igbk 16]